MPTDGAEKVVPAPPSWDGDVAVSAASVLPGPWYSVVAAPVDAAE